MASQEKEMRYSNICCNMFKLQTYVIDNGQLLNLSVTLNIYQTLQESYEMEVKGCIAKNLKSCLSNHFNLQKDSLKTSKEIEFIYCLNYH